MLRPYRRRALAVRGWLVVLDGQVAWHPWLVRLAWVLPRPAPRELLPGAVPRELLPGAGAVPRELLPGQADSTRQRASQ